jgi:ribosomal protein S18 acetylase RimI-like enzyme
VLDFLIRPLTARDRAWLPQFIAERWGTDFVVAHGEIFHPASLPGFVAHQREEIVGVVTYTFGGDECEIISLDSLLPGRGIGTELVRSTKAAAERNHSRRLWLITTNDNLNALRFYQKRGFVLVQVNRNAIEVTRQHKSISRLGMHGIPIRDEIELEIELNQSQDSGPRDG